MAEIDIKTGSPMPLGQFHAWCRAMVESAVANRAMLELLFADGRYEPQPVVREYSLEGTPPGTEEFFDEALMSYPNEMAASR